MDEPISINVILKNILSQQSNKSDAKTTIAKVLALHRHHSLEHQQFISLWIKSEKNISLILVAFYRQFFMDLGIINSI